MALIPSIWSFKHWQSTLGFALALRPLLFSMTERHAFLALREAKHNATFLCGSNLWRPSLLGFLTRMWLPGPPAIILTRQRITGVQPGFLMTIIQEHSISSAAAKDQMSTAGTQSTDPLKERFEAVPNHFHFRTLLHPSLTWSLSLHWVLAQVWLHWETVEEGMTPKGDWAECGPKPGTGIYKAPSQQPATLKCVWLSLCTESMCEATQKSPRWTTTCIKQIQLKNQS